MTKETSKPSQVPNTILFTKFCMTERFGNDLANPVGNHRDTVYNSCKGHRTHCYKKLEKYDPYQLSMLTLLLR